MRPETVPLLLVALLLLSAQPGVESFTTVVGGSASVETPNDAVLVVDGNVTVPAGVERATDLYVLDGTARINGTLDGDIVQLAGTVTAGANATVTGRYDAIGGTRTIAPTAAVTVETVADPLTQQRSPAEAFGLFVLQALGLALVAFLAGRRFAGLFENVAHSIRVYPVVSGTVGLLATVTLLALFVFMAFTLLLLPISILGLLGGGVVLLYAYVALGYLVGQWLEPYGLPLTHSGPGRQTALGALTFFTASELLGFVPLVGGLVPVVVLLIGIGAVVITYFGLREFHPPELAAVE